MNRRLIMLTVALTSAAAAAMGQTVPAVGTVADSPNTFGTLSPVLFGQRLYANWSDLPFTVWGSQAFGYNSNILGLAQGEPVSTSSPLRGDLFSTTIGGASTKAYLGAQQFFADGSYGITRYRVDTVDDTHQYSLDAGVVYQITSRCSGRVVAVKNLYQTPIEELISPGINNVMSSSVTETGTCQLTGYVNGILDSGWSSSQNSNAAEALNNYNSVYVRGGVEYSVTALDTLRATTTLTQRQFTDRGSSIAPISGLASGTDQIDYQLHYNRIISPKLTFDGMIGLTQLTIIPEAAGTATVTQSVPVYSAALTWQPTPKLSLAAASSRAVGAPSSTLSNAETTNTQNATISYILSPKISAQAGIAKATTTGGVSSGVDGVAPGSGSSVTIFCRGIYSVTPFITATASLTNSDRTSVGFPTKDTVVSLGLSYRPQ